MLLDRKRRNSIHGQRSNNCQNKLHGEKGIQRREKATLWSCCRRDGSWPRQRGPLVNLFFLVLRVSHADDRGTERILESFQLRLGQITYVVIGLTLSKHTITIIPIVPC